MDNVKIIQLNILFELGLDDVILPGPKNPLATRYSSPVTVCWFVSFPSRVPILFYLILILFYFRGVLFIYLYRLEMLISQANWAVWR